METVEDKPKNALTNGDFSAGKNGWQVKGEALFLPRTTNTKPRVRLGPGTSSVRQRYRTTGLQTLWFGASLTPEPMSVAGRVRVACFDTKETLLLEAVEALDKNALAEGNGYPSVYLKTHARTAYVILSIEKEASSTGYLYADSALLQDDSLALPRPATHLDLDSYLIPFWKGTTMHEEAVLLLSEHGEPPSGKLLFPPQRLLSVRDYAQTRTFVRGRDFSLSGKTITALPKSTMPTIQGSDFEKGDLKWYKLAGKHLSVTYNHRGTWRGPVPRYEGNALPHTLRKLRNRTPLTIVAYGDSITHGIGTSGDMHIAPYMPTWAELLVHGLKRYYKHSSIQLYNTALGGMTSDWGRDNATAAVASLNPDLVLIAFGMNDFWWMSPERFHSNIQEIIRRVRTKKSTTEFILIASMRFDPAYARDPKYRNRMVGYTTALRSLVGNGVRLLDMDAISGALAAAKKPRDLISDPLHPNDFLARWYAQGLMALLCKTDSA